MAFESSEKDFCPSKIRLNTGVEDTTRAWRGENDTTGELDKKCIIALIDALIVNSFDKYLTLTII